MNAVAKIPYVRFEKQAREDRSASIEKGHVVMVDVDVVHITPPGSKDTVVRDVKEWLEQNKTQMNEGRLDPAWYEAYTRAYSSWVETGETPEEGTNIRNWPLLTPAQVETLTSMKILTVEGLAGASEDVLNRLGMGGRALKEKASQWLEAQNGSSGKLAAENEALRVANEELNRRQGEMADALAQMKAQIDELKAGTAAAVKAPAAPAAEVKKA